MRSVWNALQSSMQRSSTLSCCLKSKSAWNWSRFGPSFDCGAPGQLTLKSGLAMSVTRSLYFSRIWRDLSTSSALSSVTFLFHMLRSSIQPSPKSFAATEQARSKSAEISSLITERRKGQLMLAPEFLAQVAQT